MATACSAVGEGSTTNGTGGFSASPLWGGPVGHGCADSNIGVLSGFYAFDTAANFAAARSTTMAATLSSPVRCSSRSMLTTPVGDVTFTSVR
jgi:hypothetical protein